MTTPTPASAGKKAVLAGYPSWSPRQCLLCAGVGVEDRLHDGCADVGLTRHVVLLRR